MTRFQTQKWERIHTRLNSKLFRACVSASVVRSKGMANLSRSIPATELRLDNPDLSCRFDVMILWNWVSALLHGIGRDREQALVCRG